MKELYLGKIVNTHGIRGEIRLISNFDKKEYVFHPNFSIYIGEERKKEIIKTYRKHKNFDMITLEGIKDINDVLKYVGSKVYIKKDDLHLKKTDYVLEELIGLTIISNEQEYGTVKDVFGDKNILLEISFGKKYYIPYNDRYIEEVNIPKKIIKVKDVEELIL